MKRASAAVDGPTFDALLLREIAAAFQRRRKAIAYRPGEEGLFVLRWFLPREPAAELYRSAREGTSHMDAKDEVKPPGQHPFDPADKGIDAIAFALERIQRMFALGLQHRNDYLKYQTSKPNIAEEEMDLLEGVLEDGLDYVGRLAELLLAGYTIDRNKRIAVELRKAEPGAAADRPREERLSGFEES